MQGLNIIATTASGDTGTTVAYSYSGDTSNSTTNAMWTVPMSGWQYWQNDYYPNVIHHSYPLYLQERAKDSGKQAFEVLKALQDKKILNIEKVSDFIEAMDTLIKIL